FSIDWLNKRESADHRARAPALLAHAHAWLNAAGPSAKVVDLGAGTGSTLRALNANTAHWHLVDQDAALLAEAQRRHGASLALETHLADLREVHNLPLQNARLVSASALFDLVSENFCAALAARAAACGAALYAALNYDGLMRWAPAHPLDTTVRAAFNRDQRRDKGFGPALGPEAVPYLSKALRQQDYAVTLAESPWLLGPQDAELVRELCHGCAAAVSATLDASALDAWLRYRLDYAASGTCVVGHLDLWAQPQSAGAMTDAAA
ncbi:MAG: class I SAM-dependent methyltransferase, partial [Pseudomonadales bacterium]|nr:class I SAM-dependent methyltransferase [Pseudomonadales bacterium]